VWDGLAEKSAGLFPFDWQALGGNSSHQRLEVPALPNAIRPLFSCASADRTRGFFKRLGFETWQERDVLVVADDGAEIAYLEIPPPEGEPLPEAEHRDTSCAILVEDVMAWHERIATSPQRFRTMTPPTYRGAPRADVWDRLATAITDPDGNLIWFLQRR